MNNEQFMNHEIDQQDHKKVLIEEVKSIDTSIGWREVDRLVNDIKRKWRRLRGVESIYEEELEAEFEKALDELYGERKELYSECKAAKEELIEKAKKLANSTEWNKTTEEMTNLLESWKAIGSAGRDLDQQLWESFQEARQVFFDNRRANWASLQEKRANASVIKKELIEKVKSLKDSTQWNEATKEMNAIFEEWKKAGSAARSEEDKLWEEFNGYRKEFFAAREAYYEKLHAEHDANKEAKVDLVSQAEEIAESEEYNKENTQTLKELGVKWKAIGYSGKHNEDRLWELFRKANDSYFHGLDELNAKRREERIERMEAAISRKEDLIEKQTRQIEYLKRDAKNTPSESQVAEINAQIEDKEAFVEELKAQIEDIKKSLEGNKK